MIPRIVCRSVFALLIAIPFVWAASPALAASCLGQTVTITGAGTIN